MTNPDRNGCARMARTRTRGRAPTLQWMTSMLQAALQVLPGAVCKAGSRAEPQEPPGSEVPTCGPSSGSALLLLAARCSVL